MTAVNSILKGTVQRVIIAKNYKYSYVENKLIFRKGFLFIFKICLRNSI
jgi:hypothetical protein